ncbi:MAG: NAD-dependent epimerase/dehydratase family protein [Bdellovibrionota bacterium]
MVRPILVTGATGFLGSHVVSELYKSGLGSRVHLMLRSDPREDSLLGLHFKEKGLDLKDIKPRLHFADLKDKDKFNSVLSTLKNVSTEWIVIHLAAVINSQGDEAAQEQVNFDRTRELLEWSNQNAKRFIYTSSIVAFGGSIDDTPRDESSYKDYSWLNTLDGYSRSKRKAHNAILETSKISTVILCPGIIHGAYENRKSSRAHLQIVLKGKVRWVPGGIGAFASLQYVGEQILAAVTEASFDSGIRVRLLNDICLKYVDYFQLYRDCAGKEKIKIRSFPTFFIYFFILLYGALRIVGKKSTLLGKLIQALLNYNFTTARTREEGLKALESGIRDSFIYKG